MSYTDKEIKERYDEMKVKIATAREATRKEFDIFRESLKNGLDPKYCEELGIDIENLTAEKWLPHLYSEPYDGEKYEEERKQAEEKFEVIRRFKEGLKEKAAEAMGI